MKLGIFGGTFDPVHFGHLLLAEFCREQRELDSVWFVPAASPPHKQGESISSAEQRIAMLKLAIGGHAAFEVSTLEIERGGISYTWETLQALKDEDPSRELFFLMGADALHDLPTWREPGKICELALPVVARRAGVQEPDVDLLRDYVSAERLEEIRAAQVEFPHIGLSSRDIRARVAAGKSVRFQMPRAVEKYLETQGLYLG